jgi:hypothetical protein
VGPALGSALTVAAPEHRGSLVSAIYVVVCTALSVSTVMAGEIDTHVGLHDTAIGFCAVLAALAATALVATPRTSGQPDRTV